MKVKKSHVSIGLLVLILSLTVIATTPQSFKPQYKPEIPKSSDGEITIITPENRTYREPDDGFYPATYGFESDETGTNIDFIDLEESTGSCTLTLIPSFNNHEKVLDLYDTSWSYSAGGKNIFDEGQDYGTVEFWWALSDVTRSSYVWLEDSSANDILVVRYSGSSFGRFDNGGWQSIPGAPTPSNNQWYHIRIDWELTAGGYMGLSQNNFSLYIDGIQYGPYTVAITNTPDRLYLQTGVGASGGFHFYMDAIGYSWDPNYNIGDNLNEGLLLSYDNTTTLDWKGLSLDGQLNQTILGNTTIPMPADGGHNIQVFGNDTMGTMYESNLRYFTVDTSPYLNIVTPENKTITEPDNGYYPATYGFESDEIGTNIDFIELEESTGSCTLTLIPSFNNHKKVLDLYDTSSSYSAGGKNIFDEGQDYGTVEFWWALSDVTRSSYVWLEDSSANDILVVRYSGSSFGRFDSSGWQVISGAPTPSNNQWYHIRIDWELTAGGYMGLSQNNFSLYIDGIQYGPYTVAITNTPDRVYLQTGVGASGGFHFYIDAIGYSWDPHYNIGDNYNEGLLLNYDSNIAHNWTGFSLDGGANNTILGNTTIQMPTDGVHSIQVFSNNSLGSMYESDVRYFTTNALVPDIMINSPISNQLYGTIPPDFSLSILDSDLDSKWYSLDGGTTNVPFSGLTGTIDQAEWEKIGNGTVTITFYANDTANNIAHAEVMVRKDIIAPVITINSPSLAEEFDYTPIFGITITEANLDEFWYTLDSGTNNYTITSLTGSISQVAWDAATDGPVTIRFYARDDAGNIGTNSVIVAKVTSELPTPPPGIPGYNLIALVGVCCIVTSIIIKKKRGRIKS